MHNQALKRKLYVIIFEADTPAGKLFDVTLIWCILLSVGLVILESLQGLPVWLKTPFIVMEYLLTAFFTFEYITDCIARLNLPNMLSVLSESSTCWLHYRFI